MPSTTRSRTLARPAARSRAVPVGVSQFPAGGRAGQVDVAAFDLRRDRVGAADLVAVRGHGDHAGYLALERVDDCLAGGRLLDEDPMAALPGKGRVRPCGQVADRVECVAEGEPVAPLAKEVPVGAHDAPQLADDVVGAGAAGEGEVPALQD